MRVVIRWRSSVYRSEVPRNLLRAVRILFVLATGIYELLGREKIRDFLTLNGKMKLNIRE